MSGVELRTSGIKSNHSTNWATTTQKWFSTYKFNCPPRLKSNHPTKIDFLYCKSLFYENDKISPSVMDIVNKSVWNGLLVMLVLFLWHNKKLKISYFISKSATN